MTGRSIRREYLLRKASLLLSMPCRTGSGISCFLERAAVTFHPIPQGLSTAARGGLVIPDGWPPTITIDELNSLLALQRVPKVWTGPSGTWAVIDDAAVTREVLVVR